MTTPTPGYSYGQRLECIRDDHGLTIKAMAASVGVAAQTWRKYEKDETFPSPVTIGALCGIYHVNKEWLDTNEGEQYTDGYKPGDELGEPISFKEMMLRELRQMPGLRQVPGLRQMPGLNGVIYDESAESAEEKLNQIIEDLQEIQDRIAVLSDELDEDMLEEAEDEIDIVIDKIGDVIEKHGWKVR